MAGFVFDDKSEHNCTLSSAQVKAAFNQFNITCKKVGVFADTSIEEVLKKYFDYELDYVQLHGDESIFYCQELKEHDVKIIKSFFVGDSFCFSNTSAYSFFCDYFLFDIIGQAEIEKGGKFDWDNLLNYKGKTPYMLSGGIKPEDIDMLKSLSFPHLAYVDINSAFEFSQGHKDLDLVADFIYRLKRHPDFDKKTSTTKIASGY